MLAAVLVATSRLLIIKSFVFMLVFWVDYCLHGSGFFFVKK